ncbi:hypothetical protein [Streptomyces sp. NPDC093109]|uniref:hypothetical protein n=1 Tax=Streptomyces sp. NPDC093109 TaxID=3154977 RepID=UPI003450D9AC
MNARKKINKATRVTFHLDSAVPIPPGRVVRIVEGDGTLDVHVRKHEAKPELIAELNVLHAQILGAEEGWGQEWADGAAADRADEPAENLEIADVYWRIARPGELPRRSLCTPLERKGRFAWVIRPGAATPQLCREMTAYLRRITGDGLWRQRWGGKPPRT